MQYKTKTLYWKILYIIKDGEKPGLCGLTYIKAGRTL
jgi:hypothetical protein